MKREMMIADLKRYLKKKPKQTTRRDSEEGYRCNRKSGTASIQEMIKQEVPELSILEK